MSAADILTKAKASGVSIRAEGGQIIAGPKRAVSDELRAEIKAHKADLIATLTSPRTQVAQVARPMGESQDEEYTLADLAEMDKLLRELAELEGWTKAELEEQIDESRRMAPANVQAALRAIRSAHRMALGGWPEKPAKRSRIILCRLTVIDGGKAANDSEPRAA